MQHLVVHHIRHHKPRHVRPVQLSVNHNLLQRRIEASQLRPPRSRTPTQRRLWQRRLKISSVQLVEHRIQIVMRARRPVRCSSPALLPQRMHSFTHSMRIRKRPVRFHQFPRRPPPVKSPQQNRCRRFDHHRRRILQRVRQPNLRYVVPKPDRQRQPRIRVVFHQKLRRPSFASNPRKYSLENCVPARHGGPLPPLRQFGFLRMGTGVNSFCASATSLIASCVPSSASSSVSLYMSYSGPPS